GGAPPGLRAELQPEPARLRPSARLPYARRRARRVRRRQRRPVADLRPHAGASVVAGPLGQAGTDRRGLRRLLHAREYGSRRAAADPLETAGGLQIPRPPAATF